MDMDMIIDFWRWSITNNDCVHMIYSCMYIIYPYKKFYIFIYTQREATIYIIELREYITSFFHILCDKIWEFQDIYYTTIYTIIIYIKIVLWSLTYMESSRYQTKYIKKNIVNTYLKVFENMNMWSW